MRRSTPAAAGLPSWTMPLSVLPDATATPKRAPVLHERVLGGARAAIGRGRGYESQPVGQRFTDAPLDGYFIDFRAKTTSSTAATPTYGVQAPWYSAMAQGQIASVFARVAESTGDAADAELAIAAIQPLLRPTHLSLVALTPEGPVLEEAPSDRPSRILNGWIFALVGLHEVGEGLHDTAAAEAFREGIVTLESSLPLYDVGWWSRYSLFPHRFVDLAKPFYQRLHVAQLDALHRLTGVDDFAKASIRWAAYDRPLPRSRALAQKAVFRAFRGEPE
jgi:hypothetical protein